MAYKAPDLVQTKQNGRQLDAPTPITAMGTKIQGTQTRGYVPKPQASGQVFPKKAN